MSLCLTACLILLQLWINLGGTPWLPDIHLEVSHWRSALGRPQVEPLLDGLLNPAQLLLQLCIGL